MGGGTSTGHSLPIWDKCVCTDMRIESGAVHFWISNDLDVRVNPEMGFQVWMMKCLRCHRASIIPSTWIVQDIFDQKVELLEARLNELTIDFGSFDLASKELAALSREVAEQTTTLRKLI